MRRFWALFLLLLLVGSASAEKASKKLDYDLKSAVVEYDFEHNTADATGHAILKTQDGIIKAQKIHIAVDKSGRDVQNASAEGTVSLAITQDNGRKIDATSDKVTYIRSEKKAQLRGNVVVVMNEDSAAKPTRIVGENVDIQMPADGDTLISAEGNAEMEAPEGYAKANRINANLYKSSGSSNLSNLEALGDAFLKTADGNIKAQEIKAVLSAGNKQIDHATALDNVLLAVTQTNGRVINTSSEKLTYLRAQNTARLSGNVSVLMQDPAKTEPVHLTGESAVIQLLSSGNSLIQADGKAHIKLEKGDIRAEQIQAEIKKDSNELGEANAVGNVHARISQGPQQIVNSTCDRMVLLQAGNKAVLYNNVYITVEDPSLAEPAHLTGHKATVSLVPPRKILMEGNGKLTELRVHPRKREKK